MSTQLPAGKPIHVTAAVTNAEGANVPDSLTWSTTAGTLTVDDPSTLAATVVNAPLGPFSVNVTDGNLTASLDIEIVDATPAAINLSATA